MLHDRDRYYQTIFSPCERGETVSPERLLAIESPWLPLAGDCPRFGPPPRLNAWPFWTSGHLQGYGRGWSLGCLGGQNHRLQVQHRDRGLLQAAAYGCALCDGRYEAVPEIPLRLHEIGPRTLITIRPDAVTEIPLTCVFISSLVRIMEYARGRCKPQVHPLHQPPPQGYRRARHHGQALQPAARARAGTTRMSPISFLDSGAGSAAIGWDSRVPETFLLRTYISLESCRALCLQLRYTGILDTVRVRASGYIIR
jgi:hypothetical protein